MKFSLFREILLLQIHVDISCVTIYDEANPDTNKLFPLDVVLSFLHFFGF